jgi:hypothetical protein
VASPLFLAFFLFLFDVYCTHIYVLCASRICYIYKCVRGCACVSDVYRQYYFRLRYFKFPIKYVGPFSNGRPIIHLPNRSRQMLRCIQVTGFGFCNLRRKWIGRDWKNAIWGHGDIALNQWRGIIVPNFLEEEYRLQIINFVIKYALLVTSKVCLDCVEMRSFKMFQNKNVCL